MPSPAPKTLIIWGVIVLMVIAAAVVILGATTPGVYGPTANPFHPAATMPVSLAKQDVRFLNDQEDFWCYPSNQEITPVVESCKNASGQMVASITQTSSDSGHGIVYAESVVVSGAAGKQTTYAIPDFWTDVNDLPNCDILSLDVPANGGPVTGGVECSVGDMQGTDRDRAYQFDGTNLQLLSSCTGQNISAKAMGKNGTSPVVTTTQRVCTHYDWPQ